MKNILAAGGVYCSIILALGFVLGSILIAGLKLGEPDAALLEIPFILAASWSAAIWCVAVFSVPPGAAKRLTMGFVAFSLLKLAELGLSVILFGRTASQHFASYTHVRGVVGLAAQILLAFFPYMQGW
jgi:hypothetical protein